MTYTTKELSRRTWQDFDALFSRGGGWDFYGCMAFQADRVLAPRELRTRPQFKPFYRAQKRDLVERRRAHGILVYAEREPVGWCQFGATDELTVETWRRQDAPRADGVPDPDWRITCFVTDKRHRRHGVAQTALRAALDAIRERGGGVAEGLPIAAFHPDPVEAKVIEVAVPGVGVVHPVPGTFGDVSTPGTLSMFEREGFVPVGVHRGVRVIVRRDV